MDLNEVFAAQQVGFPILSALILWPVLCALSLLFFEDERLLRKAALAGAGLELALSAALVARFTPRTSDMQFVERRAWIPTLDVSYHVGVDGISVAFVPLMALLVLMVMLYSWNQVRTMKKGFFAALFAFQAAMIGIFCALDLALFFVFWELSLIPAYFLIAMWGIGPQRRHAASKYTLYMLVGSAPVLLGIVLIAVHHHTRTAEAGLPATYGFDYIALLRAPVLPADLQTIVFFLLFMGFAVKGPLFPFHTWLPSVVMECPIGMGVLMTGVKLGMYAILRFVLPLAPDAVREWFWLMATLGVLGILYGALIALVQPNLRRMLAFSGVSHVGFVILGLSSLTQQGIQGALIQMVNMGFISTGLFFIAGFLYSRLGSSELSSFGGIAKRAPILAAFFLLIGLAGIGLPGTSGFAGEHLILLGAFRAHPLSAVLALGGVILGAGYFLRYFERAFLGPVVRPTVQRMQDLRPREWIIVASLSAAVLWIGVYPSSFVNLTGESIRAVAERMSPESALPREREASAFHGR